MTKKSIVILVALVVVVIAGVVISIGYKKTVEKSQEGMAPLTPGDSMEEINQDFDNLQMENGQEDFQSLEGDVNGL